MPSPTATLFALSLALGSGPLAGDEPPVARAPAPTAPVIELITMSPGEELYTLWGHAALRVTDRASATDVVYNFGSVDFSDGFLLRMLRGHVEAFVAVSSWGAVVTEYGREDRTITRRQLDLSPEAARALAARLAGYVVNGRMQYRYHHLRDNCATRVADEIDLALGGRLAELGGVAPGGTFRQHALHIVERHALLYVVLDVLLAAGVDDPINLWEARFLPSIFGPWLDRVRLGEQPVVGFQMEAYTSRSSHHLAEWTWPWVKIYLLFLVPLLLLCGWFPRAGVLVWAGTAGLLGAVALIFWVGTSYDFVAKNWNVLALPPTHLGLAVLAASRRWHDGAARWLAHRYLLLSAAVLAALALGSALGLITQAIDPILGLAIPPTVVLALRLKPSGGR